MKTAIIIQARMTSTRFPGKTVALLHKVPVLVHVLKRCMLVPNIDGIIVASPRGHKQKPIKDVVDNFNRMHGSKLIEYFTGDEFNVLARYYMCASMFGLDYIVRVTADCPLIDPTIITKLVNLIKTKNLDYASNVHPDRTFAKGLDCEVFTYDCLEAAYQLAQTDHDKEHVTPWMQNEDEVKKGCIKAKTISTDNYCVDYPEDISRLEKLMKKKSKILRVK